ncbi:OST-HTH/LOTUS domain-containing protein [Undibacterium flavidum]|uniref:HTH OST-type domain-containing protein n=1 Tax=Undibacterium flavidum TaxID=2762297 RepID=A0ABR6YGA2_9BURK|nr:OST-HTH/LOTUS domain-containing protein [Undibacterium flavidum]MBC3875553.1 hypothetical protein [Undibacterium flavidum]
MNEDIVKVQQEVQRKFGRCMFRLQQIEQLLKILVSHASVQGHVDEILNIQNKKLADISRTTMGGLVSLLWGELCPPATTEEIPGNEPKEVSETGWISTKFQISMPDKEFEKTKQALVDFVDLRNGLVHQFIERFKISSISECHKADAYLDECDEKIGTQLLQLQLWSKALCDARTAISAYIGTTECENAFLHGVLPDGDVQWNRSTIVEYLRSAEKSCALHGWTLLDTAIEHIRMSDNTQTPSKYGCKTWREVLRKSEQFDIKKNVNLNTGKGQVWYRSRMIVVVH